MWVPAASVQPGCFAAAHFHSAGRVLRGPSANSGSIGLSAAGNFLVLTLTDTKGNILGAGDAVRGRGQGAFARSAVCPTPAFRQPSSPGEYRFRRHRQRPHPSISWDLSDLSGRVVRRKKAQSYEFRNRIYQRLPRRNGDRNAPFRVDISRILVRSAESSIDQFPLCLRSE
jgi:hypothetical protein